MKKSFYPLPTVPPQLANLTYSSPVSNSCKSYDKYTKKPTTFLHHKISPTHSYSSSPPIVEKWFLELRNESFAVWTSYSLLRIYGGCELGSELNQKSSAVRQKSSIPDTKDIYRWIHPHKEKTFSNIKSYFFLALWNQPSVSFWYPLPNLRRKVEKKKIYRRNSSWKVFASSS